jgi:S-adenosylmethionine hydrolase
MSRPIVLITDFGLGDFYAGVVRAVLAAAAPASPVVDLTHDIPAHDIDRCSFILSLAVDDLPPDAVVVAVVDPGVGGPRRALIVEAGTRLVVGPDNGFLSDLIVGGAETRFFAIDESAVARGTGRAARGATFHGRDVFAPVGAALARGATPTGFGTEVDAVTLLRDVPSVSIDGSRLSGSGRHVDTFGNILTDIPRAAIERVFPGGACRVTVGGLDAGRLRRTYGDAAPGEMVVLLNSWDRLEAAVNGSRAADRFAGLPPRRIRFEVGAP